MPIFNGNKKYNNFLSSKVLQEDHFLKKIYKKKCYVVKSEKYIKFFKNYENSFIFLKTKKKISKKNYSEGKLKFIGINKTYQKKIQLNEKYLKRTDVSYKVNLKKVEKKLVIDIAYKNFKFSRFHLDRRLPVRKSNLVKKHTLKNYFSGDRSDKIFVQFYKNRISGFCLLKFENINEVRIDLICIDKNFSKKGLATDLLKYCLYNLQKLNKKKMIASTQVKNLAAIKLYKKLKFIPKSELYLYHYIS